MAEMTSVYIRQWLVSRYPCIFVMSELDTSCLFIFLHQVWFIFLQSLNKTTIKHLQYKNFKVSYYFMAGSLQDFTKYRKLLKIFLSILKTWPKCKGIVTITFFDRFSISCHGLCLINHRLIQDKNYNYTRQLYSYFCLWPFFLFYVIFVSQHKTMTLSGICEFVLQTSFIILTHPKSLFTGYNLIRKY